MNPDKKIVQINKILSDYEKPKDAIKEIKTTLLVGDNRSMREIVSSFIMVIVGIFLIYLSINVLIGTWGNIRPALINEDLLGWLTCTVTSIAAGCIAAGFTGNINIKFHWVQASGSLAIVVLLLITNPYQYKKEVRVKDLGNLSIPLLSSNIAIAQEPDITSDRIENTSTSSSDESKKLIVHFKFPTGLDYLQSQALILSQTFDYYPYVKETKVFKVGTILSVPYNKLIGDDNYYIKIIYNKLISDNQINEVKRVLKQSNSGRKVIAEIGNKQSDIEINLIPISE